MGSRIIIDPDGDIYLRLQVFVSEEEPASLPESSPGGNTPTPRSKHPQPSSQRVRVSSKVLSLASPVFRAMFSGKYKEAVALADASVSLVPYTLDLPEDDAEATILLCRIMHFKTNDADDKPTPDTLQQLAMLADKYQCAHVVQLRGALWVRGIIDKEHDLAIDDLCSLLIFAYAMDLHDELNLISFKLVISHQGRFSPGSSQAAKLSTHPLLSHDLPGKH